MKPSSDLFPCCVHSSTEPLNLCRFVFPFSQLLRCALKRTLSCVREMSAAPSSAAGRVISSRLRVIQRDFLTRRGGRANLIRSSTAVNYCPAYMAAYKADPSKCPRLIDAEVVHGDEQAFWTARRDFYRSGASSSFYPVWDRQAQVLVMLTREVARVPQEAAFRLFTLGLKMLLLPRIVVGTELLLPSWLTMNTEALLAEAGLDKKNSGDAGAKAASSSTESNAANPDTAPGVAAASNASDAKKE